MRAEGMRCGDVEEDGPRLGSGMGLRRSSSLVGVGRGQLQVEVESSLDSACGGALCTISMERVGEAEASINVSTGTGTSHLVHAILTQPWPLQQPQPAT